MNQEYDQAVELNHFGYGIVFKDKKRYLVPNLLPGEKAIIQFFQSGYGKVEKLIETSPLREKAKCPKFNECGGCQLQHLSYENQLELKTEAMKNLFVKYGFDPSLCLPIIGMKVPYFYRNKVQMVLSVKDRKIMSGLYEENTHKIVNIDRCVIQDDQANSIIKTCRKLMQEQKIKPYSEDTHTGLVRYIFVRTAVVTGEILVALVTAEEMFPGRNNFVKALRILHPEITTIVQNINSRSTSIVLGDRERILYGKGMIEDELLGKKFLISTKTFYQVNHRQTELMYKKALELAKPKQDDIVLDLYSGIGTIGIVFSDYVKQVIGVEINKDSVHHAIMNAKINRIKNTRFFHADAHLFMNEFAVSEQKADIVIVDPPREGLEELAIKDIIQVKPVKIVYLSCNPDTVMRDINIFTQSGYQLVKAQPIDMFPQTYHVESISLLLLK